MIWLLVNGFWVFNRYLTDVVFVFPGPQAGPGEFWCRTGNPWLRHGLPVRHWVHMQSPEQKDYLATGALWIACSTLVTNLLLTVKTIVMVFFA